MSDKIKILSAENFDEVIAGNDVCLVDFWAEWCGPCKMLLPIIDQVAEEFQDKVAVCKVNIDDSEQLADRFGITTIPTVMVFKGGEVVETSVGFRQKAQLANMVKNYI